MDVLLVALFQPMLLSTTSDQIFFFLKIYIYDILYSVLNTGKKALPILAFFAISKFSLQPMWWVLSFSSFVSFLRENLPVSLKIQISISKLIMIYEGLSESVMQLFFNWWFCIYFFHTVTFLKYKFLFEMQFRLWALKIRLTLCYGSNFFNHVYFFILFLICLTCNEFVSRRQNCWWIQDFILLPVIF